jgi:hypothetical protein
LGKEDVTMAEEGDRIAMSQRERDRLRVLQDVKEGRYTQVKAAELLKLTVRQVRRLQRAGAAKERRRSSMACAARVPITVMIGS